MYMGGFRIYQDNYADFTVVSNRFIDEYMEDANDAQLKIYLYLMRMLHADLPTGVSDIADRFNYTEKDVLRAFRYWEKKHLLELDYDSAKNLVGVHMLPLCGASLNSTQTTFPAQAQAPVQVMTPVQVAAPTQAMPPVPANEPTQLVPTMTVVKPAYEKPQYSKDDLVKFKTAESSAQLVFVAEQYLQKTLSVAELSSLFYISDVLHFSDDLIDYLLQYCVGREKTDYRYIEAVALDWAHSGITTPKQAASHARKYDRIVYEIMNALGKNSTSPSNVEVSFINKWTKDFGYDMSVISVACERTVLNTDRKRFNYADSILTKWHDMGVRHKADINTMDPIKKISPVVTTSTAKVNKFNQFSQNAYDYDALEKRLINN